MKLVTIAVILIFNGKYAETRSIKRLDYCDCGITKSKNTLVQHRIIGGIDALANEFPWTVGLYTHPLCRGLPVCGGALISAQHVLTAAHCVEHGTIQCINMGDHDVTTSSDAKSTYRGLHFRSSLIWSIHESYFHGNDTVLPRDDIAILLLDEPVDFAKYDNIRPLCLPHPWKNEDVSEGVEAQVAGWGLLGNGQKQSLILQKVNLTTVSNEQCKSTYGETIIDTHLCAYEDGKDACQGDSGGPIFALRPTHLRRDEKPRMEAIGITSFGQECAKSNVPGVYTRANRYVFWLMRKMTDFISDVEVCNGTFGSWIMSLG